MGKQVIGLPPPPERETEREEREEREEGGEGGESRAFVGVCKHCVQLFQPASGGKRQGRRRRRVATGSSLGSSGKASTLPPLRSGPRRPFQVNYTGSTLADNEYVSVFDEHLVSHYHKPHVRSFFARNAIVDVTFEELGGVYRKAIASTSRPKSGRPTREQQRPHQRQQQQQPQPQRRPVPPPQESEHPAGEGGEEGEEGDDKNPLVLSPRNKALTGDHVQLILSEEEYSKILTAMRNFGDS